MDQFEEILARGGTVARRAFLKCFINEIVKEDRQATIHYALPMPPSRMVMVPEGVLDTVPCGGTCTTFPHQKLDTFYEVFLGPAPRRGAKGHGS